MGTVPPQPTRFFDEISLGGGGLHHRRIAARLANIAWGIARQQQLVPTLGFLLLAEQETHQRLNNHACGATYALGDLVDERSSG